MSFGILDILKGIFIPLLVAPTIVFFIFMYIPDEPDNHKVGNLIVKYVIPTVVAFWILEIITFVIKH